MLASFAFIAAVSAILNGLVFLGIHPILHILQVPESVYPLMYEYVRVIFFGIGFVFLYNFFAYLLRALGNSVVPLWFLGIATILNIVLDVLFVVRWNMGVGGAAAATVIAQALSGAGIGIYTWVKEPELHPGKREMAIDRKTGAEIVRNSFAACIQQSVMNFGILMIQGLVNSFGPVVRDLVMNSSLSWSTRFSISVYAAVVFWTSGRDIPFLWQKSASMPLFFRMSKKSMVGLYCFMGAR